MREAETGLFSFITPEHVRLIVDRDKGKCDLESGRRQVLVEWEGQNQSEIKLIDATDKSHGIESLGKSIRH